MKIYRIFIFLLVMSIYSSAVVYEDVDYKDIRKECYDLYVSYLGFLKKTNETSGDIQIRWKELSDIYKVNFLKCNTNKKYKREDFMKVNPLNSLR